MKLPSYWRRATRELSERDPVMRKLVAASPGLGLRSRGDAFSTLARSIVGQQISVKAAASVWERLEASIPAIRPEVIDRYDAEELRACGLSRSKVTYLKDLAHRFVDGTLEVARWETLSDEELIAELTQVRGIGRWTAEMFLIFYMTRPNVLPLDDLGLQRAISLNYNRGRPLAPARMNALAKRWLPWRSVATWYLWRSLDPVPVEY